MAEPKDPGGSTTPAPAKTPAQVAAEVAAAAAAAAKKQAADNAAKKAAADAAAKKKAADAAKAKAATDAKAKADAASTAAETAASFGWSIAFFNSIPELKGLLKQATDGQWSPARFTAALQGTSWFRHTNEAQRKYATLRATDPTEFSRQIAEGKSKVANLATSMGIPISLNGAQAVADRALREGWGEDHLRRYLTSILKPGAGGNYTGGEAATFQSQFRALAENYGVSVSEGQINSWVHQAVIGGQTPESVKALIQNTAASKYPALAQRIKAGETVSQIADPYKQSYAKLLEVNPDTLNLNDPLIQRALQAKDQKGRPTTQTVYDFENTLRNDPRWAKTDNSRDQMSSTANNILQTFGLA